MRPTLRVFASLLISLLVVFCGGWYALTLGPDNPVPWPLFSVWASMTSVGMVVEQAVGYVPYEGRPLVHAALVVGGASLVWAVALTPIFVGIVRVVRIARGRRNLTSDTW